MLSLQEIHSRIEATDAQLEELVSEIAEAGAVAAECEATFKSEFAEARLQARANADDDKRKITTDEAEDRATASTVDARRGYLLASNNLRCLEKPCERDRRSSTRSGRWRRLTVRLGDDDRRGVHS